LTDKKKHNGEQDEPSQEYQNFQRLLKGTLSVPKEELDEKRAEYERKRERERDERTG
jgi:hypothetical protein